MQERAGKGRVFKFQQIHFILMKLKSLQQYLTTEKIGLAILIHPDIFLTYFSQIQPSYALMVITPKTNYFYLTKLDQKPKIAGLKVRMMAKDWEKKHPEFKKAKKVGLNYSAITLSQSKKLKKLFPKARLVDISKQLAGLRAEKTLLEIKKIEKACQITDFAFNELLKALRQKKFSAESTEQEIADFLEAEIKCKGAELAFPTIVASGKNSAIPHHQTSSQKLKPGFLLLDFGAKYQYYCADMSRTIYLGTPSKKEILLYELLLKAQKEAVAQIKENLLFSELEKSCRRWLAQYSSYFIHSLGHGVGLEVHEKPSYAAEDKKKILKNEVFTIEPGLYFPGRFGIRIEDTVLFDGKAKVLTKSRKELMKVRFG